MVRGPLPKVAMLGPSNIQRPEVIGEQLVQLTPTGTSR
jgi:hypothetical protein